MGSGMGSGKIAQLDTPLGVSNWEIKQQAEWEVEKSHCLSAKALHSKLLTKLLSRFSSRNEFFAISEVRV
jgi:hypothetical protein